jgi:hypothetical protein
MCRSEVRTLTNEHGNRLTSNIAIVMPMVDEIGIIARTRGGIGYGTEIDGKIVHWTVENIDVHVERCDIQGRITDPYHRVEQIARKGGARPGTCDVAREREGRARRLSETASRRLGRADPGHQPETLTRARRSRPGCVHASMRHLPAVLVRAVTHAPAMRTQFRKVRR